MNNFYVYRIGILACVRITKTLRIRNTMTPKKASYWTNKREAKSWEKAIKKKFPTAKLVECELKFIR